jgi:homoserine kinase
MANAWAVGRAPATIANVGPGFDVFAMAIRGPSDEVAIRAADRDALTVEGIGAGSIPTTFSRNTAGIVIGALREATGIAQPLEVRVVKGIPPSRGLGSSAASCAAAALAFLKAFPDSGCLGPAGFIRAAVKGEDVVSGRHYDNVCGALFGGFVSIASTEPLVFRRETVSDAIHLSVVVPELDLHTAAMRKVLPASISLDAAVSNVGKAATLALGLIRGDAVLAGRCLADSFAEPHRSPFIKGYPEVKAAALEAGARGCAISGSGSSVFAISSSRRTAERAADAMQDAFEACGVAAQAFATVVANAIPVGELVEGYGPQFSFVATEVLDGGPVGTAEIGHQLAG